MQHAISLYTFNDSALAKLVEEFADYGFDTFSFNHTMLLNAGPQDLNDAAGLIARRGYSVTLHVGFEITPDITSRFLGLFGDSLRCITFDRVSTETSTGITYDVGRMKPVLANVAEQTRGTGVLFGVEDFPLDAAALELFREGIEPFLGNERFGTLIDLGHLNYRLRSVDYFRRLTPEEYLARVPVPIIEIHVHDNKGNRDDHAHIGYGNCDFAAAARGLRAAGFDGVSTIEICGQLHNSTPAAARAHVRESLETWQAVWAAATQDNQPGA